MAPVLEAHLRPGTEKGAFIIGNDACDTGERIAGTTRDKHINYTLWPLYFCRRSFSPCARRRKKVRTRSAGDVLSESIVSRPNLVRKRFEDFVARLTLLGQLGKKEGNTVREESYHGSNNEN